MSDSDTPTTSQAGFIDYVKLIVAVVQFLASSAKYLSDRQLIDAGQAETIATAMREQADGISSAKAARKVVLDAAARDPAGVLRDNDGHLRD